MFRNWKGPLLPTRSMSSEKAMARGRRSQSGGQGTWPGRGKYACGFCAGTWVGVEAQWEAGPGVHVSTGAWNSARIHVYRCGAQACVSTDLHVDA